MKIFRCPRCQKGKLYAGLLKIAPACDKCGFSYTGHEQGDGPAFIGILVIGTLAGMFAAITEVKFAPPLWVHAVLWFPFIMLGSVFMLRLAKAALVSAQYRLRSEDFLQRKDGGGEP